MLNGKIQFIFSMNSLNTDRNPRQNGGKVWLVFRKKNLNTDKNLGLVFKISLHLAAHVRSWVQHVNAQTACIYDWLLHYWDHQWYHWLTSIFLFLQHLASSWRNIKHRFLKKHFASYLITYFFIHLSQTSVSSSSLTKSSTKAKTIEHMLFPFPSTTEILGRNVLFKCAFTHINKLVSSGIFMSHQLYRVTLG